MIDQATKILSFIQVPNVFRDFVYTTTGLGSFFLLQLLSGTNILANIQHFGLGRIETDLIVIAAGFLFGRLLSSIADLTNVIWFSFIELVILVLPEEPSLKKHLASLATTFKARWRKYVREFIDYRLKLASVSKGEAKEQTTMLEIADAVSKYPFLSAEIERNIYNLIFLKAGFATFLIAGIWLDPIYLFIAFSLWTLALLEIKSIDTKQYKIFVGVVKADSKE